MDAETSRRISDLAASLKRMHLATTMEEATARAKEIILSTTTGGKDRPIGQLVGDARSMAAKDLELHSKEETDALKKKISKQQQAVEDANTFVEMADDVQQSK